MTNEPSSKNTPCLNSTPSSPPPASASSASTAPPNPDVADPIQPPYRTRMGVPVCEDCGRVRCICGYKNYE